MSIVMDRMKASFNALVRAGTARIAYAAPRFARVVKAATASDGSTTLDVAPEDPAFPTMGGIPLFHGLPGISLTLATGTRVVVEFSEADPARPFVRSWAGGESVMSVTWNATALSLGGDAALPAIVGPPFLTALETLVEALNVYVVAIQLTGTDPANAATPVLTAAIQAFVTAAQATLAISAKVL